MPQTTDKRARGKGWMPVVIACALLIGAAMWASTLLPLGTEKEPPSQRNVASVTTITTAPTYFMLLKEWNGQVALFLPDGTEPLTVYEVNVMALPEEERRSLAEGIAVNSEEELASILENYTS